MYTFFSMFFSFSFFINWGIRKKLGCGREWWIESGRRAGFDCERWTRTIGRECKDLATTARSTRWDFLPFRPDARAAERVGIEFHPAIYIHKLNLWLINKTWIKEIVAHDEDMLVVSAADLLRPRTLAFGDSWRVPFRTGHTFTFWNNILYFGPPPI